MAFKSKDVNLNLDPAAISGGASCKPLEPHLRVECAAEMKEEESPCQGRLQSLHSRVS